GFAYLEWHCNSPAFLHGVRVWAPGRPSSSAVRSDHDSRRCRDGGLDDCVGRMRRGLNLAILLLVSLWPTLTRAQGTGPVGPVRPDEQSDSTAWSFAAAGYGYIVPDEQSYFSPTFRADRGWAHLEARYNYEDRKTGSIWLGYNLSVGENLVLDATPMV